MNECLLTEKTNEVQAKVDRKICFKCGELKPLDDFYKHPMMADGRVNKCKECNKRDVRANRKDNVCYYREYDKLRWANQERKARIIRFSKKYRRENPKKYEAHCAVNNAVRDGRLKKQPCFICGKTENIHGHHHDYSQPLSVIWLCAEHHAWMHPKVAA